MSNTVPDFTAARDHVIQQVVDFARRLRAEGVAVPADAALAAVEGLAEIGLDDRRRVRASLHATLVSDPRDSERFEELFPGFWYRLRSGLEATATHDDVGERSGDDAESARRPGADVEGALADSELDLPTSGRGDLSDEPTTVESRRIAERGGDDLGDLEPAPSEQRPGTYSPVGGRAPVVDETVEQGVDRAAVDRLEGAFETLTSRRWTRSGTGTNVDARRALRESLDTGGIAMTLPHRERGTAAFRTCVLVDVSRSVLDAIDRGFVLSFLAALVTDGRSARVFFFDTDIREVTDAFAERGEDPGAALERAEVAWGGGTRIGESLGTLRERWPDAVDRRTVTLVISDGLEVGAIPDLTAGMAWLARRSRAVLWLNPLATSVAYEPTCRGMDAANPYVDGLFAFGGNADIVEIARQLEQYGLAGPIGYRHDFRDRTEVQTG